MSVKWLRDKKGISPVIGVILMVAITVILAAVIASFVFGYSGKLTEAPPHFQARLDKIDNTTKNITIIHAGGDVVDLKDIKIIVKHGNTEIIYDSVEIEDEEGGAMPNYGYEQRYDAFGPMDKMDIYIDSNYEKKGKIFVNDRLSVLEANYNPIHHLDSGKIVEIIFIHKPTGQVVLRLSGEVEEEKGEEKGKLILR